MRKNSSTQKKVEIEAYSRARSRGVNDESILRWDRIITQAKLPSGVVEGELIRARSLEESISQKNKEVETLDKTKASLESAVSTLERKQSELDVSLKAIGEKAVTALDEKIVALGKTVDEYSQRLSEGARFEEELKIARLVSAITKYPGEARGYPLSWALLLVETARKLCALKAVDPYIHQAPSEHTLLNFLDSAIKSLTEKIGEEGRNQ